MVYFQATLQRNRSFLSPSNTISPRQRMALIATFTVNKEASCFNPKLFSRFPIQLQLNHSTLRPGCTGQSMGLRQSQSITHSYGRRSSSSLSTFSHSHAWPDGLLCIVERLALTSVISCIIRLFYCNTQNPCTVLAQHLLKPRIVCLSKGVILFIECNGVFSAKLESVFSFFCSWLQVDCSTNCKSLL